MVKRSFHWVDLNHLLRHRFSQPLLLFDEELYSVAKPLFFIEAVEWNGDVDSTGDGVDAESHF